MSESLRHDIGRLLWIGFEGCEVDDNLRRTLQMGDAGGVTLFARNLPRLSDDSGTDLVRLRALNDALHDAGRASGEELLISVDQEGGRVQRIRAPARHYPPMHHFAAMPDAQASEAAEAMGAAMGAELSQWGFDIDFAPILDVHTNPFNPIIGDRAFADHPEAAALRALAFARGLHAEGVLSCGKHFPGHGDTATDSHLTLPRLEHDMARLRSVELVPFAAAARAELPMLMTAHVVFAALDDRVPATLSSKVISDLLRGELGYQGVVVSDDLDMKAVADNFGVADAAVAAIVAGCDVLLLCRDPEHQEQARSALHREAAISSVFRSRLGESAARVRGLPSCV